MSGIKSINNERAKFAYDELLKITKSDQSKFRTLTRSFPTMVQVNGLTAAVAFLFSKKDKSEHGVMYDIIYRWLKSKEYIFKCEENELICSVTKMESRQLQLVTTEVMALLVWMKRFAEGMFESDE